VDDDKVDCPNARFSHIQDAIDAASPGDEIHICKGIYVEQIKIGKPLDIEADDGAILMPSSMQANATSLFDAAPIATALLVTACRAVISSSTRSAFGVTQEDLCAEAAVRSAREYAGQSGK
jgi:nitrous oxidase accessory protein NosD